MSVPFYIICALCFAAGGVLTLLGVHAFSLWRQLRRTKDAAPPVAPNNRVEPQKTKADQKEEKEPACPECGGPMLRRKVRRGKNAGKRFLGCTNFPDCKGRVELPEQKD